MVLIISQHFILLSIFSQKHHSVKVLGWELAIDLKEFKPGMGTVINLACQNGKFGHQPISYHVYDVYLYLTSISSSR
jgi:hypothetical protein